MINADFSRGCLPSAPLKGVWFWPLRSIVAGLVRYFIDGALPLRMRGELLPASCARTIKFMGTEFFDYFVAVSLIVGVFAYLRRNFRIKKATPLLIQLGEQPCQPVQFYSSF